MANLCIQILKSVSLQLLVLLYQSNVLESFEGQFDFHVALYAPVLRG